MIRVFTVLLIMIIINSCFNDEKSRTPVRGVVKEAEYIHWGMGYFKLNIYVEYKFNDHIYIGSTKLKRLNRVYMEKVVKKGDIVLISVNKRNPQNIKYIKRISSDRDSTKHIKSYSREVN